MAKIFISYSRADSQFIEPFTKRLKRARYSFWYDDEIHGGADWWQMILREISKCTVFIYLLSNDSLQSTYCRAELKEAIRLNKRILPIIVRPRTDLANAGVFEQILRDIHYIDLSAGVKDGDAMAAVFGALNELLSEAENIAKSPAQTINTGDVSGVAVNIGGTVRYYGDVTINYGQPVEEPPVPDKKKAEPTLRTTYIAGGFVLLAAVITGVFGLWQGVFADNDDNTPVSQPTTAVAVVDTEVPDPMIGITETPTPTNTSEPTNTPRPANTLDPLQAAFTPVTSNADWTPIEREFDGVMMVLVPAGCFPFSASEEEQICFDDPFWIDQTEVTNQEYGLAGFWGLPGDLKPRDSISQTVAIAYCSRRPHGFLPSESQWEYAARGPDGNEYPWGNSFDPNRVVYAINADQPRTVGEIETGQSWVGAYDLSGNLWEWTSTNVARFAVARGGSWDTSEPALNLGSQENRLRISPNPDGVELLYLIGFRCARSID